MISRLQRFGSQRRIAEKLVSGKAALDSRVDEATETPVKAPGTPSRVGVFWAATGIAPADPLMISGKYVAAAEWTRALARYGRSQHLDIFTPASRVDHCRRLIVGQQASISACDLSDVQFWAQSDISSRIQNDGFDILHEADGVDFARTSYIRSRLSPSICPLTCPQMGISYRADAQFCFTRLLAAQICPCDAIVCSTPASREAMQKRLSDVAERYSHVWNQPAPPLPRLELIPWGVNAERFAGRDRGAARLDLDLPHDRPIILCLARVRIEDKMDWTPLLLAFEQVRRRATQRPLLLLAGGGNPMDIEYVAAQVGRLGLQDDVRTFFNFPPACLTSLYAACDVFVSPADSPSESFGLTIVEAMACGRPVVASDWNGYRDLIIHGETGFRVRTDWADCLGELNEVGPILAWDQEHLHVGQSVSIDMGQMVAYLQELLEHRELREEMGRRGRARVEALYDWPVVVAQWEALWGELLAVARSIDIEHEDGPSYLQANYFAHFCHYASRIVDDTIPVQLTARGKELLAGRFPLLLHHSARGFLDPEYLYATLAAMKPLGLLGTTLPLGKLLAVVQKSHGLPRDRAMMHVMWLAKYDLIALVDEEPRSR
jgi:D-inositol-3-phosphate glycosyltransferase